MSRREIRLSGEGGQGIILGGIILAEAAAVHGGLNAVQTQSYGPESRGGASRCEVVLSREAIDYPKVIRPDVVLVMNREAADRYAGDVSPGGTVIVDSTFVEEVPDTVGRVCRVPITRLAREHFGREIVANIIALGIVAGLTDLVRRDALERAVADRVPPATRDLNLKALDVGYRAAAEIPGPATP
ncbi:MAG: 2-oxoacid:acceptor oxidoreductase family protein [bacterium]|nr:2-oxoacid:acceptor oxidoreductase family protein [bacterium]